MPRDPVDGMLDDWARERPEIDAAALGVFGRIKRVGQLLEREVKRVLSRYGLEWHEFDVLATLRRSGEPYELPAGALLQSALVTSGAITNRVDRLEHKGLVRRRPDPGDRRSVRIGLTEQGLKLVDEVTPALFADQAELLAPFSDRERTELADRLRDLSSLLSERQAASRRPS